jgi:hypothetical protein
MILDLVARRFASGRCQSRINCIGLNRSAVGSSVDEKPVGRGVVPLVG